MLMTSHPDAPGPDHAPRITQLGIAGVIAEEFPSVPYKHGSLTEIVNDKWTDVFEQPVQHLYLISNPDSTAREEWYVHHATTDRYVVVEGHLDVALFDDRSDSPTAGELVLVELVGLGTGGYSGVIIPVGVWHSFRSRQPKLLMLNAKLPGYKREQPDKNRMPMPNESTDFEWAAL